MTLPVAMLVENLPATGTEEDIIFSRKKCQQELSEAIEFLLEHHRRMVSCDDVEAICDSVGEGLPTSNSRQRSPTKFVVVLMMTTNVIVYLFANRFTE
jgi:hypothetical protein